MDVVEPPEHECGQDNRILLGPRPIHLIDEIVHERGNAIMRRRIVGTNCHRTRSIFPRVRMQARDCVEIQRLHDVLRQKWPPQLQRGDHHRSKEIILTVTIGDFQLLIGRVLFAVRQFKEDQLRDLPAFLGG